MFSVIYYFSGTGNSLAVARKINEKLTEKSEIVSIPTIGIPTIGGKLAIKADRVGFVFPVYIHKAPDIVKRCIANIEFLSSPYIFAVATHNGEPGRSLLEIQELLAGKGQLLSLASAIAMPGNAFETDPDTELERLSASEQSVSEIANLIESQKEGGIDGEYGFIKKIRSRIVGFVAWNYEFSPKRFRVSNDCEGCRSCEKLCPVHNIHLVDHRPEWKKKCTACLACFHWCPKEAISMNNFYIKKRRKYRHPEISIQDMVVANSSPE